MTTTPDVTPASDDLYAALFAEVDKVLAGELGSDEPVDNGGSGAVTTAAPAAPAATVDTPEPALDTQTAPAPAAPAAPANATPALADGVDKQIDALARASIERIELERKLAEREAELAAFKAPKPVEDVSIYNDADITLTPEELEAYRDNIPVIDKLIKNTLKQYDASRTRQIMQDVTDVRNQLSAVGSNADNAALNAFALAVNTAIPDLGLKMRTPEWEALMNADAPMSGGGAKVRDLWDFAEKTRNINAMHEIAKSVQLAKDQTVASPGSAAAPAPASAAAARPRMMPYSRYTQALQQHASGQISYEQFDKIRDAYLTAEAAGLVDESA